MAVVGYFGKVPAKGDFVSLGLPQAFVGPWDAWLRTTLLDARERHGAAWQDRFLASPAWRFVVAAGVCGANGWAGVLCPSLDRVGRAYPLTLAVALPDGDARTMLAEWAPGYERLSDLLSNMMQSDAAMNQATVALIGVPHTHALPTFASADLLTDLPDAALGPGEARLLRATPDMDITALCRTALPQAGPTFSVLWHVEPDSSLSGLVAHGLPTTAPLWEG